MSDQYMREFRNWWVLRWELGDRAANQLARENQGKWR